MNRASFGAYFFLALITLLLFSTPFVFADENTICTDCKQTPEQCKGIPKCKVCSTISCGGTESGGSVSGICVSGKPPKCLAKSATGAGGGSMGVGDLSKLMSAIGDIMKALGGGAAGGGSPPGSSGTGGNGAQGCTQYYQVATTTSDPCAYYVPPVSANISTNIDTGSSGTGASSNTNTSGGSAVDLISALLGGNSNTNTAGSNSSTSTSSSGATTGQRVDVSRVSSSTTSGFGPPPKNSTGDFRVTRDGATIIVQNQNPQNNSVIAGFYGIQSSNGQSQGIVASWCKERPWASNFLSIVIPPVFFDSLCTLRGYKVGQPVVIDKRRGTPIVTLTQRPSQVASSTNSTNSTSSVQYRPAVPVSPPMQVDIWAVPPAVRLGARTTIFWNSKGAATCIETSPDGSFSHTSLSGGGATVPLSGPTTFSISCQAPDGTHVADFVTVNLSI